MPTPHGPQGSLSWAVAGRLQPLGLPAAPAASLAVPAVPLDPPTASLDAPALSLDPPLIPPLPASAGTSLLGRPAAPALCAAPSKNASFSTIRLQLGTRMTIKAGM